MDCAELFTSLFTEADQLVGNAGPDDSVTVQCVLVTLNDAIEDLPPNPLPGVATYAEGILNYTPATHPTRKPGRPPIQGEPAFFGGQLTTYFSDRRWGATSGELAPSVNPFDPSKTEQVTMNVSQGSFLFTFGPGDPGQVTPDNCLGNSFYGVLPTVPGGPTTAFLARLGNLNVVSPIR